jgi:hypothetical protein
MKFHENSSIGPELFHVDRQADGLTDLMNVMVAFHNFVNAPKIVGNFYIFK